MKVTHRRNIIKREKKFGYASNSTIGLDLAGAAANVIAPDAEEDDVVFIAGVALSPALHHDEEDRATRRRINEMLFPNGGGWIRRKPPYVGLPVLERKKRRAPAERRLSANRGLSSSQRVRGGATAKPAPVLR